MTTVQWYAGEQRVDWTPPFKTRIGAQAMITTEQRRTIEARLDRLDARAQRATSRSDMQAVIRGILDLLRDVLLSEGQP
jgi:hypothetical protein